MNFKTISTLALASTCCFNTVAAEDFSYSYIEGGIAEYNEEAEDVTYLISGSYNVSSNFNLLLDYSTTTLASEGSLDLDYDTVGVGIGYHRSLKENTDFTASLKYVSLDLSVNEGFASAELADVEGYSLGIGMRHKFSNKVEVNLGIDYVEIEDESDTNVSVGGRYYFNKKFSGAISYRTGEDDTDGIAATLRYDFK